jgi:hypothetical protein
VLGGEAAGSLTSVTGGGGYSVGALRELTSITGPNKVGVSSLEMKPEPDPVLASYLEFRTLHHVYNSSVTHHRQNPSGST